MSTRAHFTAEVAPLGLENEVDDYLAGAGDVTLELLHDKHRDQDIGFDGSTVDVTRGRTT